MTIEQPSGAIRRIDAGQVTDAVLSADSKTIYVTAGGSVVAYSLVTGAQTGSWAIGTNLGAIDIAPDGTTLMVIERQAGATSGVGTSTYTVQQSVYRLDLASGTATTFTRATPGGSVYQDVVALAGGKALMSEGYYTYSSTLTALDTGTGTFSIGPVVGYAQALNTDKSHTHVLATISSGYGTYALYDVATGTVTRPSSGNDYYPGTGQAISPDASRVASTSLLQLFDSSLNVTAKLQSRYLPLSNTSGVAFSPDSATLYAVDASSRAVFAFDSASGDVKGVYPVGANVKDVYNDRFSNTLLASADGHYLTVLGSGSVQVIDLTTAVSIGGTKGDDIVVGDGIMSRLFGFEGNDTLYSGSLVNIELYGGRGDDVYHVDTYASVTEYANEGYDTIYASFDVTGSTSNIEKIVLTGSVARFASGDDGMQELVGNEVDNSLDGRAGDDVLAGNGGNDMLTGGYGADRMSGGTGDDSYDVDNIKDVVIETENEGTDKVYVSVDYVLPDNVENLVLSYNYNSSTSRYATIGRGNVLDNVIQGNAQDNTLYGEAGNDTLTGEAGVDVLYGGAGNDTYRDTAFGLNSDTIGSAFEPGDRIVITDANIDRFSFTLNNGKLSYSGGSLTFAAGISGTLVARATIDGGIELLINTAAAHNDFNGDGRSDILWRNADGSLSNWLARADGGFLGNDAAAFSQVPPNWQVTATADLNGDGREDILWRSKDGALSNWLARADGGFTANDGNGFVQVSTDWQIAGTGDFNGDGRDDILWRNADGRLSDWLGRNDGGYRINDSIAATSIPTDWQVAGTGDFNGDGRADILWRNADGRLSDWLGRSDGGFVGNDAAVSTQVGNDWSIVGTGDFNGDGRDDILWRNADGSISNWLGGVDGGFVGNDAAAFVAGVSNAWSIADVGDYNGDGRDDILWRSDSGAMSNWLSTGSGGFVGNDGVALTNVSTDWHIA